MTQYKVQSNCLVEVERMKRPLAGNFIDDEDNFYHAIEVYNNHVASLRSYPLAPGHPWKEGEVIGEDQFEVRDGIAHPSKEETQEELWEDVRKIFRDSNYWETIKQHLKESYAITKKVKQ